MHSEYDENIRQNTFFNELVKNHSDIITKATQDNWIICIPRSGTLESTEIGVNIVLDHVLIPSDDGSVRNFQIFSTLSKKQLHIKQNEILLGDCQFFSNVVNILFKETFYEKEGSKYTVWCIDKPFFLDHLHSSSHLQVLETLPDCIDFLWVESLDQDILQQIQNLCLKFTESNSNYEWEHIQTQKDLLGNLYSRCLQKSLRINNIREKGANSDQYLEKIKLAVETYMQYCLYKKIIFGINTFYVQSDVYLNKIINRAQDVSDENLEIDPSYNAILLRAKSEFNKLNNSATILDKVNCLDRTFNTLCRSNNGNSITSDDLLQMFVSLILKLHTYNWISTLNFIRDFKFCTSTFTDHVNYLLTTLEAAIEYIKGNHFFNLSKMASYHTSNESNIFHFIRVGNLIALKELFENSENNDFRMKLCHPLCLCDECEKVTKGILIDKDIKNEKKQTLLTYATIHEKTEIVEYLLHKDLNVNWQDIFGKTALHYASERGYQDILLLLLSVETVDINIQDNKGNTPLHVATSKAQDNCVKALIYSSSHLNTNVHNLNEEIPILMAAKAGYLSIVQILLENCGVPPSDADIQSTIHNSHNYFITNYIEQFCIQKLLHSFQYQDIESEPEDKNKSVENNCKYDDEIQVNLKKINLLTNAIKNSDFPLACFYLGFNYTIEEDISPRCHPLCNCEKCQGSGAVETDEASSPEMDSIGEININMCNTEGYAPLHVASQYGKSKVLRILLDCGANVNIQSHKTLYTSLHLACIFQQIAIVKELVKCNNCNVNARDYRGNTPLFYACSNNDSRIIEILLKNDADYDIKNFKGRTVWDVCQKKMLYCAFKTLKNNIKNNGC